MPRSSQRPPVAHTEKNRTPDQRRAPRSDTPLTGPGPLSLSVCRPSEASLPTRQAAHGPASGRRWLRSGSSLVALLAAVSCAHVAADAGPAQTGTSAATGDAARASGSGVAIPSEFEQAGKRPVELVSLPPAPTLLIRGGTVMTVTGQRFSPGYVLLQDGKIVSVGPGDGTGPSGATVVDATGRFVTPGLIDSHSHLGVYPSPGTDAHNDGNEATDPNTAGVWAEHSFWPEDPGIERAVAGGVTTADILPGSANLIGGRGVVLHLRPERGSRAMRLEGAPEILKMACGENPKRVYGGQKRSPSTRMANIRNLRESLFRAQKYQRDWVKYQEKLAAFQKETAGKPNNQANGKGPGKEEPMAPDRDPALETLARLLGGEVMLQWHCYTADDMLSALQVADEFGFKVRSFHHAVEAYKIRDILASKQVAVSTWADWYGFKVEAYHAIPENLALVHSQGARAIVHSDSAIGIQMLNQEAAKGMASGNAAGLHITEEDALRWITLNPAWALGIDHQVGSLEPGKRADVVVWTADPFTIRARAEQVLIDGRPVYDMRQASPPWSDFELGYTESVRPRVTEVKP